MKQIVKIAIEGGPCGGKDNIMPYLHDHFTELGYAVFITPEAATHLINKGFVPNKTVTNERFQEMVFAQILEFEAKAEAQAKKVKNKKVIIFCNRGLMSGLGYTTRQHYARLLKQFNGNIVKFRDARYVAIIHLRTAALGAEAFYTLKNNTARMERPEEARALDARTLNGSIGHPHLRVIPNKPGGTWETKVAHAIKEICHALGEPEPLEIERKFLVEIPDWSMLPHFERVMIIQHYLLKNKDGIRPRIRARGQNGSWLYTETIKQKITEITRTETERMIKKREYQQFIATSLDPSHMPIHKERNCFVWEHQYFELDVFITPRLQHALLEIELTEEQQEVILPPFLKILREVTGEPEWKNSTLAKRKSA